MTEVVETETTQEFLFSQEEANGILGRLADCLASSIKGVTYLSGAEDKYTRLAWDVDHNFIEELLFFDDRFLTGDQFKKLFKKHIIRQVQEELQHFEGS